MDKPLELFTFDYRQPPTDDSFVALRDVRGPSTIAKLKDGELVDLLDRPLNRDDWKYWMAWPHCGPMCRIAIRVLHPIESLRHLFVIVMCRFVIRAVLRIRPSRAVPLINWTMKHGLPH